MDNSCLGVIVNAIDWRIHFDRLLVPIKTVGQVKARVCHTRRRDHFAGGNPWRIITILDALFATDRIGHLNPFVCSRLPTRKDRCSVGSRQRIDEIASNGVMEL